VRQNLTRGLGLAALVIFLDQLSKWWILTSVMQPPRDIPVLPFFNLVLTHNRGVSFGLFAAGSESGKWMLVGLALVISAVLVHWLWKATTGWNIIALGLIIGGAIGNVVDRVRFGAVVDFLDVHAAGYHWPAFNVADAGITVGAAILIIESLFSGKESA